MSLKRGTKVLVTGAGGFIGSHLVEELVRRGCKVRAMVRYNSGNRWGHLDSLEAAIRNEIEVVAGDIVDPYCAQSVVQGSEVVFHLAALIGIPYSYTAPQSYVDVNIKGTVNLLQAALRRDQVRFVHTSTSETYGTALYVPIDEKHPMQGQSPYSASKIGADKLVESFGLSFRLPVITVRPFNTFGPRQSARAVIPSIICQLAAGAREIRMGSTDPVRDFCYVADTVAGFIAASEVPSVNEVVNLGTGEGISMGDLAMRIQELMGRTAKIVTDSARVRPVASEVQRLVCNPTKANELLGWKAVHSLDEGLKATIEYIRANVSQYRSEVYNV